MLRDEKFMRRALELAQLGLGNVSPNPLVGSVIVHNDSIIGEGWHQKFGEAHAEVNAINSVKEKALLSSSTLYVTLEPCAHFGKTPPCSDLIIKHNIPKVVICNLDPFEKVNGRGVEKLKNAGIDVEIGILEAEGEQINKRFFTAVRKKRPYIILKWAQTADGYIARENFDSKWISNEESRKLVHKWRTEEDAILVGYKTALYDNPKLTSRDWKGKNPIRVVIDSELSLPQTHNLFDNSVTTICFNSVKDETIENTIFIKMEDEHKEFYMMSKLLERGIQSLIIEGGSNTLQHFITKGLWDEARVFISDIKFDNGIKAPNILLPTTMKEQIQNDSLFIFKRDN